MLSNLPDNVRKLFVEWGRQGGKAKGGRKKKGSQAMRELVLRRWSKVKGKK